MTERPDPAENHELRDRVERAGEALKRGDEAIERFLAEDPATREWLKEQAAADAAERYERALREIVALVPSYEESRRIADERGAEVANALTVGAWRAAEVARRALGIDDERSDPSRPEADR